MYILSASLNIGLDSSADDVCDMQMSLIKGKLDAEGFNSSPDLTFMVLIPGNTSCYVELDSVMSDILSHVEIKDNSRDLYCQLQFYCTVPNTIRFNHTGEIQTRQNLYILLNLAECSIHLGDLNLLSQLGALNSLVTYSEETKIFVETYTECRFAKSLQTLTSYLDYDIQGSQATGHFFWEQCAETFENLTTLGVIGHEKQANYWNYSKFADKFPNLNKVMFKFIDLQMPVTFKWTNLREDSDCPTFPINNQHFVSSTFQGISSRNLSSFHLQGTLLRIGLMNMTTTEIPGTYFENVHGLLEIDIHGNKLQTVDNRLFQNTTCLRILKLHSNQIEFLNDAVFTNLDKLYALSLADNQLQTVTSKLFESLTSLQELHLEQNLITYLPLDIFSEQLMLRKLYLFDNPLVDIPLMAVYLPFIALIDCHQTKINDSSFVALTWKYSGKVNDTDLVIPGLAELQGPRNKQFNLSDCGLKNFDVGNYGTIGRSVFVYIFYTYNVITAGNPFECFCDIQYFLDILRILHNSGIILDTVCQSPAEFQQRSIVTLDDSELYCPKIVLGCPELCTCFEWMNGRGIIVDCRNTNITDLPILMPEANSLELWFQHSSLKKIEFRSFLLNVTGLDVSNNSIEFLDPSAVLNLQNARYLNIDSNKLQYVPVEIRTLKTTRLTLRENPFLCDCKSLWMKQWIFDVKDFLSDWADVECIDVTDNVKQFVAVPDDMFVCIEPVPVSLAAKLFIPSIVSGSALFVLVTVSIIVYFQRFNLKVLLYIKFGIDPFNKQKDELSSFRYDAVIVFCPDDSFLAKDIIANHLLQKNFKVALFEKDFSVGYSVLENVSNLLHLSRRVVFLLSENTLEDATLRTAWHLAYERATNISMKYIILIADKKVKEHCREDSLLKYLKSNRYIKMQSRLLNESVEYLMPRQRVKDHLEMFHRHLSADSGGVQNIPVLTNYPGITQYYIRHELSPFLLENGFELKEIDMEFAPGTDIRDEIFEVLDKFEYFIYILSEETFTDEVQMFILCEAVTKTMLSTYNYLLLVVKGDFDNNVLPTKLQNYMEHYTTIDLNDDEFSQRILEALTHVKETYLDVETNHKEINGDLFLI